MQPDTRFCNESTSEEFTIQLICILRSVTNLHLLDRFGGQPYANDFLK